MGLRQLRLAAGLGVLALLLGVTETAAAGCPPLGPPARGGDFVTALRQSTEVQIGRFHLQGFPSGSFEVGSSRIVNGTIWYRFRLALDLDDQARLTFYSEDAPPGSPDFFLSGQVRRARVCGEFSHRQASDEITFRIPEGQETFSLVLGSLTSRLDPLYGGTLDLAGRKLYIENAGEVSATPDRMAGVIAFHVADVVLRGARLALASGEPVTLDLRTVSPGKVDLRLDLADGTLRLVGGEMWSDPWTRGFDPTQPVRLAGSEWPLQSLSTQRLTLQGDPSGVRASLSGLELRADRFTHVLPPRLEATLLAPATARQLAARVPHSTERIVLEEPAFDHLDLAASELAYLDDGGSPRVRGAGRLTLDALTDADARGTLALAAPQVAALATLFGRADVPSLEVSFSGPKSGLRLDGTLSLSALSAGTLALAPDAPLQVPFRSADGAAGLTFGFDIATPAGRLALTDGAGGEVVLEGRLARLAAHGTLGLGSDGAPALHLSPSAFHCELEAAAARRRALFGGIPDFAGTRLAVHNPGELKVASGSVTGGLEIAASVFALGGAGLGFSADGAAFVFDKPLQAEGAVALSFDLATSRLALLRGRLAADDLRIAAAAPGRVSLAGLEVESPVLALQRLAAEAGPAGARIELQGLELQGGSFSHTAPPSLSGTLVQPLRIAHAEGTFPLTGDALQVESASLSGLSLAADPVVYRSTDGFTIEGNGVALQLAELTSERIDGSFDFTSGRVRLQGDVNGSAALDGLHLAVHGPKNDLAGEGRVTFSDFGVRARSPQQIHSRCGNRFPLDLSFQAGRIPMDLRLTGGRLAAAFHIDRVDAGFQNGGYYRCEYDEPVILVHEQRLEYKYPCPTWSNPFRMCDGWTTLVPEVKTDVRWLIEVHQLNVSGRIEDIWVRADGEGGMEVCNGKLTQLGVPTIIANYHPNVPSSGNPILDFPRDIIRGVATAVESSLASLVGSSAALVTVFTDAHLFSSCPDGLSAGALPVREPAVGAKTDTLGGSNADAFAGRPALVEALP